MSRAISCVVSRVRADLAKGAVILWVSLSVRLPHAAGKFYGSFPVVNEFTNSHTFKHYPTYVGAVRIAKMASTSKNIAIG